MKTPEQMAEEWASGRWYADHDPTVSGESKVGFLAGYKAAKDQLADADKVITYDYVETASNEAKELIAKFGLIDNEDVLVKALVAAYCRGVDAVDGYLRNSLSAYRASVKNQQWISVKDRLPEENEEVLVFGNILNAPKLLGVRYRVLGDQDWKYLWQGDGYIFKQDYVTHWMPLPEPPKEEK